MINSNKQHRPKAVLLIYQLKPEVAVKNWLLYSAFVHALQCVAGGISCDKTGAVRDFYQAEKHRQDLCQCGCEPAYLEGVCSGAVFFEDVPPACPLSNVSEGDGSCERALTKQKVTTKLLWLRARASKGCAAGQYSLRGTSHRPVRRGSEWLYL